MTALRKKDPTFEWFRTADLRRYRGNYVALAERQVAASGKDPRKVLAAARKRFPKSEIALWKVMKDDCLVL